jgi:hypothetical protein
VRRPGPPPFEPTDSAGFLRANSLRAFGFDPNPDTDAATIYTLAGCERIKKGHRSA